MNRPIIAIFSLLAAGSLPIAASAKDTAMPPPAIYVDVVNCKTLSDTAARLACYDRTVGVLDAAQRRADLVVTDRATLRDARRGLFGLSLPQIKLFGNGGEDEVQEINSTVTGTRTAADGMAVFVLADGARWKQTEGRTVYARPGDAIRVHRTAMGGFMANIKGGSGVRVIRLN